MWRPAIIDHAAHALRSQDRNMPTSTRLYLLINRRLLAVTLIYFTAGQIGYSRDESPDSNGTQALSPPVQQSTGKSHWSFVAPVRRALPRVQDLSWPVNEIDFFVSAKLEDAHLRPAPEADRFTLIRRVTLDVTGLPP